MTEVQIRTATHGTDGWWPCRCGPDDEVQRTDDNTGTRHSSRTAQG
jgi:hypothetical protein